MAIAWYICPYKTFRTTPIPTKICAMNDFNVLIAADGGAWAETEVLGNRAIVKVRASAATLTAIAGTATFRRIPLAALDDPLSSLSVGQRNAIRDELLDAGYTLAEVNARFPDLATVTLGEVLRFMASRRLRHRYDAPSDTFICDGPEQPTKAVDLVNEDIT